MIISDFYTTVRILSRANEQDLPDEEIAVLAQIEANKLYEMSVQAWNQEQTKDQTPTVLSFTGVTTDFIPTNDNLWIERVEYKADGATFYKPLKRTNKTEYESMGCVCEPNSLTDALISTECTNYFIQTSEGVHVFPIGSSAAGIDVKIYIKDTPAIDWNDNSYNIKIPIIADDLLTISTALLYRDIENTNEFNKLKLKYDELMELYKKRLRKGARVFNMGMSDESDGL